MSVSDLVTPATSFVDGHDRELAAAVTILLTVAAAWLVDRAFARQGRGIAAAVGRGDLSPVARTRLRLVRRLIAVAIVALGAVLALSQFGTLHRLASSVLASGALAAAVIGFAARQVLANAVAGVMLAITQPLRIGDSVSFEGESGTVEDIRLNYTWLRTPSRGRVIIPNERLAGGVLHNESIVDPLGQVETSLWLGHDVDADRVLQALGGSGADQAARVDEVSPDGVRFTVSAGEAAAGERAAREAELRAESLRRLRAAGLLAGQTIPPG